MTVWAEIRNKYGFQLVGQLGIDNAGCHFWKKTAIHPFGINKPSTYVVVLSPGLDRQLETVLYVGMAGKGWAVRAGQHDAGLKRVHKGIENKQVWINH